MCVYQLFDSEILASHCQFLCLPPAPASWRGNFHDKFSFISFRFVPNVTEKLFHITQVSLRKLVVLCAYLAV